MGRKAGPTIDGVQLPPDAVVHPRVSPDAAIDWDDEPPLMSEEEEREEWLDLSCGLGPDGQCGQAGSEFCDSECRRWCRR